MPAHKIVSDQVFVEQTAPPTPPTGYVAVYAKTDGHVYQKDDAGVEIDLTGAAAAPYTATIGNGTDTSITVTHNLGTRDVVPYAYLAGSPYTRQDVHIDNATTNTITLVFAVAPATNSVRVLVTTGGMGPTGPTGPVGPAQGKIAWVFDNGANVLTTGAKIAYVTVPYNCTITDWRIFANPSGSIVFDIWKDTYANHPPTVGDTITASAKPTVTTATKAESSTLTGWTTALTAGQVLEVNIDSVTTVTKARLELTVVPS